MIGAAWVVNVAVAEWAIRPGAGRPAPRAAVARRVVCEIARSARRSVRSLLRIHPDPLPATPDPLSSAPQRPANLPDQLLHPPRRVHAQRVARRLEGRELA